MADKYAGFSSILSSGDRWVSVTPSDTVDLADRPKRLWVGGAGSIVLRGDDGVDVTFAVPVGMLDLRPTRVLLNGPAATTTTATGIVAIY